MNHVFFNNLVKDTINLWITNYISAIIFIFAASKKKWMNKNDNLSRLLLLLLLTWGICLGLFYLPEQLFGWKIKKVDLLADLRVKPQLFTLDSLRKQLEQPDTLVIDSVALRDSISRSTGIDSTALALRDSLYNVMYAVQGADSMGTHIEDYSVGHIGLKRFFAALNGRDTLNRPVRIAFLGDSFIEGDILVADFRAAMQKMFGGKGVGFIPISSVAAQYRPTVKQQSKGWLRRSMLSDKVQPFTLSGMVFEADTVKKEEAGEEKELVMTLQTTDFLPGLDTVSSLKLLYQQNKRTTIRLFHNQSPDTLTEQLPPTNAITQYEWKGCFTEASFSFTETDGFQALGVAMEDTTGVIVDNYSLRGNSGLRLNLLDSVRCRQLNEIRSYDLIVLQYGLNVAVDSVMQYGWYSRQMVDAIQHIQNCFPQSDILLMGVSDRSRQEDGEFKTMPAILALLHTQRQIARKSGIAFWNTFGAMGGENSMVRFVENNWASKDYTHLGFRGGREVANALFDALLLEKEFYDEAEKVVQ